MEDGTHCRRQLFPSLPHNVSETQASAGQLRKVEGVKSVAVRVLEQYQSSMESWAGMHPMSML